MTKPLEGLLVVSLEQAVAAPLCSSRLAEAGARVIKIERAEGDFARGYDRAVKGYSSYFVWINRGKESLVLDIKKPTDAALLHRLLMQADVFIQNLAPGATERAGFGEAELRAANPRLIACEISGYGDGPYRDMKAYDLLVQAESGLASVTGSPDAPGRVGVSVADIAAGMNAHAGILQALIRRGVTGQGATIRTSLFDTLADWMTVPLMHHDYGKGAPARVGLAHPSVAPYGGFTCADGSLLVISVQNEREWAQLCTEVLDNPELATDPRFDSNVNRVENRAALDQAVQQGLGKLQRDAATQRLRSAKIAFGALNGVDGLSDHPVLRRWQIALPDGSIAELPAPPIDADWNSGAYGDIPAIGQHSDAIREEFSE